MREVLCILRRLLSTRRRWPQAPIYYIMQHQHQQVLPFYRCTCALALEVVCNVCGVPLLQPRVGVLNTAKRQNPTSPSIVYDACNAGFPLRSRACVRACVRIGRLSFGSRVYALYNSFRADTPAIFVGYCSRGRRRMPSKEHARRHNTRHTFCCCWPGVVLASPWD